MVTRDLLALCARARCDQAHLQHLAQQLSQFEAWEAVPTEAEAHGLGPLCYVHWRAAGAPIPASTRATLQGLYLRHRQANQIRTRALREILTAYQAAGIQALVLKGAALAHSVYPEPGLRPMRDLDLLVKKTEVRRAQQVLADLGFVAPQPADHKLPVKHLPAASRRVEGLLVSVELHHNLFSGSQSVLMEMDELTGLPLCFALKPEGFPAYTLGYEDMLWHLCQHMRLNAGLFAANRFIWVADLISFAEHFAAEIDWKRLKKQYPVVLNTLALLHFMSPLSEKLRQHAPLALGQRVPQGVGLDFEGWPRSSFAQQRTKGYRQVLSDTFFPAEWWLRLYYDLGSIRPLFWHRWLRHPLHILSLATQLGLTRLKRQVRRQ